MKKCTRQDCTVPIELQEFGNNKSTKDGLMPICKVCKSLKDKKYRESEKGKQTKKRNSCSEHTIEHRKEYYSRPEVQERVKKYKSTEEYKAQQRKYANQEIRKQARKEFTQTETHKRWKLKYYSSEQYRIGKQASEGKRRAKKKSGDSNTITREYLELLKFTQKHECHYCKQKLDFSKRKSVHLDHYIPLAKGGLHCISNVVWACAKCNLSKQDTLPSVPLTFSIV